MLSGLDWYWWLVIGIVLLSVPFKIKFLKWWEKRQKEKKKNEKWGGTND